MYSYVLLCCVLVVLGGCAEELELCVDSRKSQACKRGWLEVLGGWGQGAGVQWCWGGRVRTWSGVAV